MPKFFASGHALIIGIANYPNVAKLPSVVLKDASDVADLLKSERYCGYPDNQVHLLKDEQATKNGIRDGLMQLAQSTKAGDTAVIFFSGHGGRVEGSHDKGTYLIPFDCDPRNLRGTALSSDELTTLFRNIKAQKLVVLLDACHSASAGEIKDVKPSSDITADGNYQIKSGLDEKTYDILSQGAGRVIMASSRSDEVSLILQGMQNSLFTHFLLDAFKGAATTHGDGLIRVFDIFHYVSDQVLSSAPTQHPIFKSHDLENNFPLALYLGGKHAYVASPTDVPDQSRQTRPATVDGKTRLEIAKHIVDRWEELATYFDISPADRDRFQRASNPPLRLLDWLEQRKKLSHLRDAFTYLKWDELIEELERNPR